MMATSKGLNSKEKNPEKLKDLLLNLMNDVKEKIPEKITAVKDSKSNLIEVLGNYKGDHNTPTTKIDTREISISTSNPFPTSEYYTETSFPLIVPMVMSKSADLLEIRRMEINNNYNVKVTEEVLDKDKIISLDVSFGNLESNDPFVVNLNNKPLNLEGDEANRLKWADSEKWAHLNKLAQSSHCGKYRLIDMNNYILY